VKRARVRAGPFSARQGAISQVVLRLERRVSREHGLTIDELMHALEGKGHAAIIAVLALPFAQPIQVPGLSMPFGIVLFYSGLRIAFAQKPWLPGWLRMKKIPPATAMALLEGLRKVAKLAEKILHPRWTYFCRAPFPHRMHGILIAFLSILLALPLPIPMSNMLAAIPIVLIALALLEDDGLYLAAGYLAAIPCAVFFTVLFVFGPVAVAVVWAWLRQAFG
jgi:hypothetical protein